MEVHPIRLQDIILIIQIVRTVILIIHLRLNHLVVDGEDGLVVVELSKEIKTLIVQDQIII